MENDNDNTIDLSRLWAIVREHIVALVLWSIGLAIVGWGIANFAVAPRYTSSAQILVSPKGSNSNNSDQIYTAQQANMQLVTTYRDIVTSHVVLSDASKFLANPYTIVKPAVKAQYKKDSSGRKRLVKKAQPAVIRREALSYNISPSELSSYVSVSTQQQSQVFAIQATTDTPVKSKAIANAVAHVFSQRIRKIMEVNNVTIVSPAVNGVHSFPNVKLFTLAGFLIGLILSFAVVLMREMMSTAIRDDSYLTKDLGLTDLGQIAHIRMPKDFELDKNDNSRASSTHRGRKRRV